MERNTITVLLAIIGFTQLSGINSNQFSVHVSFSKSKIESNINDRWKYKTNFNFLFLFSLNKRSLNLSNTQCNAKG